MNENMENGVRRRERRSQMMRKSGSDGEWLKSTTRMTGLRISIKTERLRRPGNLLEAKVTKPKSRGGGK